MKKGISFFLFTVLTTGFLSCQKNNLIVEEYSTNNNCKLIPAKIICLDCDNLFVELQTDTIIGDLTWIDIVNGTSYHNVLSISADRNLTYQPGDIIYLDNITSIYSGPTPICFPCPLTGQIPPVKSAQVSNISTSSCKSN